MGFLFRKIRTHGICAFLAFMSIAFNAAAIQEPDSSREGYVSGMRALSDGEMEAVSGKGLFWTDKIGGSELAGPNVYSTPFTFYRVGLDGELDINANISKLQLGCGGVNDFLSGSVGCDIDIDYATLMGRNGASPGNALSAFVLKRPYLEFAIKNDGNSATREIVGMKIGAQSADGAISVGRRYAAGQINQENMDSNSCTGASTGAGALGCHSGINSISGFLGAEMSLQMDVKGNICTLGIVFGTCLGAIALDAWGCIGKLTTPQCTTYANSPLYVDIAGTRMSALRLNAALLDLSGNGLSGVLTALIGSAYASLNADLRLVHKLTFENTGDFFISMQREPVAYPRYDKMAPSVDPSVVNDGCKSSANQTARCSSAYAVPANTGWWLNAPSVKLLDVTNNNVQIGNLTLTDALSLLAAPGYLINQAEFNLTPAKNCYGATRFC